MSWVARLLLSPVRIFFLLIVGLLLTIVIDVAVTHTKLDAIGFKPGVERIAEERRVFFETFDLPILLLDPRSTAHWLDMQLLHLRIRFQNLSVTQNRFANSFLTSLSDYVSTVLPTVEMFSLRLLSLIATLPVVAICCLIAGVDGWVRREVRKAGAGIESARIYHFAKRSIKPMCLWVSLLYLVVPATINVRWAYGILAVVVPLLLGVTISRFKKYV